MVKYLLNPIKWVSKCPILFHATTFFYNRNNNTKNNYKAKTFV